MIKLGKDNHGKQVYMSDSEVAKIAETKTLLAFKGKLNNQQYAKLRKAVAKHN